MEFLTGAVCAPEYHKITKEEFDTFEDWKDTIINNPSLLKNAT